MIPIHEIIKSIRKQKGISRETIAKHLDLQVMSYGKIERNEVSVSVNKLYKIAELFEMRAEDILTYGKPEEEEVDKGPFNVTYIPIKVKAGNLTELFDSYSEQEAIQFNLPFFRESRLFMVDTEGDSMQPTVNDGDYTIIKKEENPENIKYGKPYLIDSTEGRVLKRIYQDKDPQKFLLKSDNEVYEPYSIAKETVLSLWETKGFFSKNLSPKNLYQRRLNNIENNLSEISHYFKSIGK